MSGLVRTYSPKSRDHSRSSRLLSPSCVVTRTSRPKREEGGPLVVGERLRGREVENGGAALGMRAAAVADRGQSGQLVGQRLARRRPRGQDDVPTGVGASAADRWCRQGRSIPPRTNAATTSSAAQDGQSWLMAGRGGSTSTCRRRSARSAGTAQPVEDARRPGVGRGRGRVHPSSVAKATDGVVQSLSPGFLRDLRGHGLIHLAAFGARRHRRWLAPEVRCPEGAGLWI